ncbi:MAG TPA: 3-carboxy-cis,cis-muconate cycloisomerase [Natronosporangium sp.]|nr:3-carboxy-cis,cis-muconate cycloisomerase [Natronosporangium sp.]
MRPSSSTWPEPAGQAPPAGPAPGLFDEILARGPVRAAVSDPQWLRHLLAVESALAAATAAHGLVPPAAAAAIQAACRQIELDPAELARAAAEPGNPVLPVVQALRSAVGPELAGYVHFGATSQDILDTAAMLVARDALRLVRAAVRDAAGAAAALARSHRDTPMAGRTLLQHALPVTFGLVAAGWLTGLDTAADELARAEAAAAVQLGGAAGTRHAYQPAGAEVAADLAAGLGLQAPVLPWHTDRTRIGLIAGALGTTAGAVGKVARDVSLLAGSDVAEVAEAAPGGSSAMPHKRNPVASVAALACAAQAPGLVSTLLGSMVQEHQRAAGAWHAEWRPLRELLVTVGSAAEWLRVCLTGLRADPAAMAANLDRLRATAGLTDPAAHLRAAGELVDRALTAHENRE